MSIINACPVCGYSFGGKKEPLTLSKCPRCALPITAHFEGPVLEVESLKHQYGTGPNVVHALRELNLTVDAGEIVLVVGPSGGGKTTALLAMGLLLTPTSGIVRINGEVTASMREVDRANMRLLKLGFVFQHFNLMNSLTAQENIALPMRYAGVKSSFANARAAELLAYFGLEDRLSKRPAELSGGEKQRVSIARALGLGPRLILADEPTANLDSKAGKAVIEQMAIASRNEGSGVVIVTHDVRLSTIADRLVVLEDGVLRTGDQIDFNS